VTYGVLLTLGAFYAGMVIFGAWCAHELRKRWEEYTL